MLQRLSLAFFSNKKEINIYLYEELKSSLFKDYLSTVHATFQGEASHPLRGMAMLLLLVLSEDLLKVSNNQGFSITYF